MTIAITGATGQLGRLALQHLKDMTDPADLVALLRDPARGADLNVASRAFDYHDPAPMVDALAGVDVLALISSSDFNDRQGQHRNVIAAAKAAGVGRIIYTSILKADTSPMMIAADHRATEQAIADSGLPATILRNGWYSENWTGTFGGVLAAGALVGAAGQARFSPATRDDFAQALARVAVDDSHAGQIYELGGDQAITLADIAAELSRQTGRAIPYQDLPAADYLALLVQIGLPEGFAQVLVDVDQKAGDGWLHDDSGTLARLIGRPTTPLADAVKAAL
jgi:NAD(P)H dehydrogenase (quinone)